MKRLLQVTVEVEIDDRRPERCGECSQKHSHSYTTFCDAFVLGGVELRETAFRGTPFHWRCAECVAAFPILDN